MNTMVQSLKEMGQVKMAMLVGVSVLLIGLFVLLSLRATSPVMSPLYSNVSVEDSGAIVEELEKQGIKYELSASGSQVLVPTDDVARLRVLLAKDGIPSSGSVIGYEIFDNQEALGTSNFVMNVNKLRAIEGELARTIGSFSSVESARVHLVMPRRELFTRDRQDPTASVAIKVRGGKKLSKEEVDAIRHLVATAVPRLKPARITSVDHKGNLLARGFEDENDPEALATTAQEYRGNFEKKLKHTVERLVEQTVGFGNVKAEVSAEIDFDRIETNSETFDPEGQVARSVQGIEEQENENEKDLKDDVSVANQLPDAKAQQGALVNSRNSTRTDETTNYEISKVVENHVKQTGTINRLSVAVLVDGNYLPNDKGDRAYAPRTQEELDQLRTLVESAIGYDKERGDTVEVVNMQFAGGEEDLFEEGPFDWLAKDLNSIIQTLVLGGVAILTILLIVRPLIARAIESVDRAEEEGELEAALLEAPGIAGQLEHLTDEEDEELISISRVKGGVKSATFRKINEMISQHPDEALGVVRQWAFSLSDD
jgi:flagellar M-ring protein FliF